jgi:hypothetical protein
MSDINEDWEDEDADLSEEEFDAKYSEDDEDGVVLTEEEHRAMMTKLGYDTRWNDPSYIRLRQGGDYRFRKSSPDVYIKRVTLNDPRRIERLRWKAYLNVKAIWARRAALREEIVATAGGECFVPADPHDHSLDDEEISEPERERYSLPSRVVVEEARDSGHYINTDHDFWKYQEPEHNGTEMEFIAAAAHLGEWEQVIKPDRIKRSQDPAKLALGARYRHNQLREYALSDKCHLLNEMLSFSIIETGVLPYGHHFVDKRVMVRLNGRIYFFKVKRDYQQSDYDLWPHPGDLDEVFPPSQFWVDDSLLGLKSNHVQTRLGEPIERRSTDDDQSVWVYPDGEIVLSGHGYYSKVLEVRPLQPAGAKR